MAHVRGMVMSDHVYRNHKLPINRVATRVIGKGVHYKPDIKHTGLHWGNPPVTTPLQPNQKDLTGIKFGRLTVLGRYSSYNMGSGKKGSLWLVRCDCGDYETRQTKTVNNPSSRDRCYVCNDLRRIRLYDKSSKVPK